MRLILEIWRCIYTQKHIYSIYTCVSVYINTASQSCIHPSITTHPPPSLPYSSQSIHPSIHPAILPLPFLFSVLSIQPSLGPPTVVYPSIHPSIQPTLLLIFQQSINPSSCWPTFRVSIHPAIAPYIHPSIPLSIHTYIRELCHRRPRHPGILINALEHSHQAPTRKGWFR